MTVLRPILTSLLPAGTLCLILLASQAAQANCTLPSGNLEATPDSALTDNGNDTISHAKTGLMWKKCVQGRSGASCSGSTSNLTWQAALRQAVIDNTAGFTDWRLPSRNELYSIVETGCASPAINVTRFPLTPASGLFWTSTHAGDQAPDSVWAIRFSTATSQLTAKDATALVRLVRNINTSDHDFWRIPNATTTNPAPFSFTTQYGVALGTLITSAPVTLSIASGTYTATASGGDFNINGGATWYTSQTVANGNQIRLRVMSPGSHPSTASATLTINGRSGSFLVTTDAADTTPDYFNFSSQNSVLRSTTTTSNPISVSGINSAAAISISGGTYEKNNSGSWVSSAGSVVNGDSVRVRHTSSANFSTTTNTTLTIGSIPGVFSSTTETLDTTPSAFSLVAQYDVARSATVTSAPITVSSINSATAISISGGTYDINNSNNFVSTSGTVNNGDTVRVRHTTSASYNTTVNSTLTIGGVSGIFSSTTVVNPSDTTPDPFSFTDQTNAVRSTQLTSNAITVSGIGSAASISISGGGGQYEKNNSGTWVSTSGTVNNRDTVKVRHTSSASFSTATNTTLTIGGVSDTFTTTTEAQDTTPAPFSLEDQTDVAVSSAITSAPITVSGINSGTQITVTGGTYDINGSNNFVSSLGTVNNGDTVRVRHTSSTSNLTDVDTVLTIGGVSDTFTSRTICGLSEWNAVVFNNSTGRYGTSYPCTRKPITLNKICQGTTLAITHSTTTNRFEYSLDGTNFSYVTSSSSVNTAIDPNTSLTLRFRTSSTSTTQQSLVITVGTVQNTWRHTGQSSGSCSPAGDFQ